MELDLNILRPQERLSLQLRALYERAGFRQYRMGRFEEYGLYQQNRRFLASDQVITFTDLDGNVFSYTVAQIDTLTPTALEELTGGGWDLTLFTCTVGGQARLAVRCQETA